MNAIKQLVTACPGKVESANALAKKGVTSEYYSVSQEADPSWAVSWRMQHGKGKAFTSTLSPSWSNISGWGEEE